MIQEKNNKKSANQLIVNLSPSEIKLLREELDIEDEMNEEDDEVIEDDPYFLLAQRLANAPQVQVPVKEVGEVTTPGSFILSLLIFFLKDFCTDMGRAPESVLS